MKFFKLSKTPEDLLRISNKVKISSLEFHLESSPPLLTPDEEQDSDFFRIFPEFSRFLTGTIVTSASSSSLDSTTSPEPFNL